MRSINILLVLGHNLSLNIQNQPKAEEPLQIKKLSHRYSDSFPLGEGLRIPLLIQSQMVNI